MSNALSVLGFCMFNFSLMKRLLVAAAVSILLVVLVYQVMG